MASTKRLVPGACLVAAAAMTWAPSIFAEPPEAPAPAATPPVGDDVVYLKEGGFLRGTLVEVIPGKGVRLQLVTGEVSSIAWEHVEHVEAGGVRVPIEPAPPPAPPREEPPPPPPAHPTTRLHVDGPAGLEIAVNADTDGWRVVCLSPCDARVPTDGRFEVRGSGVKTSSAFSIHDDGSGSATVRVKTAATGPFVVGIVGMAVGVGGATLGGELVLIGALWGNSGSTLTSNGRVIPQTNPADGRAILGAGVVLGGIGLASLAVGSVLTFSNLSTSVKQVTVPEAPSGTGFLPTPAFQVALDPSNDPTRIQVPLFSGRF